MMLTGYEDTRAAIAAHFTCCEAPLTAKVSFQAVFLLVHYLFNLLAKTSYHNRKITLSEIT